MIMIFSGSGSKKDNPEYVLKDVSLMLTFFNNQGKKPESRFRRIYKGIKKAKKKGKK